MCPCSLDATNLELFTVLLSPLCPLGSPGATSLPSAVTAGLLRRFTFTVDYKISAGGC